ncbi:MAG: phosphoglucosamine mutase [Clostridia bacterium]|nr:phosphoglucosamine mutase [Clostridia bacterium]
MGRMFGTDGVRGVANTELTSELAFKIGRAAAAVLSRDGKAHPKILIGKDTRISSDMLENALAAGLCSVGANVQKLGVIATPAVAYLVSLYKADAGIMISASHNSFEFNGIKIFSSTGYKLPDAVEDEIEALILGEDNGEPLSGAALGHEITAGDPLGDYIAHVASTVSGDLSGMEIAFDCANGSASATAERIFSSLGVKCHMIHNTPDGININDHCGSTHLESLMEYVREHHLAAGFAFDGDADRCLGVDENGNLVDGDMIMAFVGTKLKEQGKLDGNTIVGTILSNLGLVKYCEKAGINFSATKVGDRYVLEEMLDKGYVIGGEQSGHLIFKHFATTGDGELTAAQVLSVMKETGKPVSELAACMTTYPQVSVNVKVTNEGKERFANEQTVQAAVRAAAEELGQNGRIIVRPSGTEPLLRVMAEGLDHDEISRIANCVADVIREKLT